MTLEPWLERTLQRRNRSLMLQPELPHNHMMGLELHNRMKELQPELNNRS